MSGPKRWAGVLLLVLTTTANAQSAQDQLKRARTLAAKNQFAPALKLVDKAMVEPGNDLETTLELLELSGACQAGLKRPAAAKLYFSRLLSLAPGYALNRRGPPLVMQAWKDAKASVQPLTIVPTAPDMSGGKISDIGVEVQSDPLKLAKTMLFNYRVAGGKWKTRAVPIAAGRVVAKVDAAEKVEWYATVLGANDAEVMRIRHVDSPIAHTYSPPSAAPAPDRTRADAPRRADASLTPGAKEPEVEVVETGTRKAGWVAPVSWTLIGGGAAAGGVGTYFALQSSSARGQYALATAGSSEPVVGLTRQRALELDSQARTGAVLANTLWTTAGVMIVTGIVLKIVGPTEAAQ